MLIYKFGGPGNNYDLIKTDIGNQRVLRRYMYMQYGNGWYG